MGDGGGLAEAKLLGPTKDTTAALIQRMAARRYPLPSKMADSLPGLWPAGGYAYIAPI